MKITMRHNVVANILGKSWAALMSFAFVPLYISFLGVESYGLIGFFTALIAVFSVLDLGLSVTINREMAKYNVAENCHAERRNLLKTFEFIYWAVGIILTLIIFLSAPTIARDWLRLKDLNLEQATLAVRLMAVVVLFRWPQPLYAGALMGLNRQVTLNMILVFGTSLQAIGAAVVLWLVAPTVVVFFLWQIFAAGVQCALFIVTTWRSLPADGHKSRFSPVLLKKLFRFSAGAAGIALFSSVLTQSDKFLLSKLLLLSEFGYYALASSIAGVLSIGAMAVYASVFPAISAGVAANDTVGISRIYRQSSQFLAAILFPVGLAVSMFSMELLAFYTRNTEIAAETHIILSFLVIGNLILSIMVLPLSLQLAYGWTNLSFYKNVIAIMFYVPVILYLTNQFGAEGAAFAWICLALGYFVIEVPLMHRRLLKSIMWRWYFHDIGIAAAVSITVLGTARAIMVPTLQPSWTTISLIVGITSVAICITTIALPSSRAFIRAKLTNGKPLTQTHSDETNLL